MSIGHVIFGTSNSVLCGEVYYTVSLFRRVHYWRFHCILCEHIESRDSMFDTLNG